jgi:hypothetical protein
MPEKVLTVEETQAIGRVLEREFLHGRTKEDRKRVSKLGA